MSHFNAGNVWGVVKDTKPGTSQGGKRFLGLHLDCSGAHGQVNAFGRIWGDDQIESLQSFLKDHPHDPIRLRGYFSMFFAEVKLYNFTWWQWEPLAGIERKAAFVLRGIVTGMKGMDAMGRISLKLIRPGKNGQKDIKEEFDVYAEDPGMFAAVKEGDTVEVKGYLQQIEDEFGANSGPALPFIKAFKKIESEPRL